MLSHSAILPTLRLQEGADGFLSNPIVNLKGGDAAPPLLGAGQIIADRLRIQRFIARGGMGEVYEAEDLVLAEKVALKTIRLTVAAGRGIEHMKQEIHAARRVTHPNVCRTFDIAEHGDPAVTLASMELLEGPTLARHLHVHGPFSRREALPLIRQIIAGLQAAHDAGVTHRDFKPGNVILAAGTEGFRPVITDFGLAHSPGSAIDRSEKRAGTPGYMAPEQMEGGPISPATDVYSLGVVIAEMVGARQSAAKGSPESPSPKACGALNVDEANELGPWRPVIERCLQQDPAKRYQRPADAGAALYRAFASWISRHRIMPIMAAVVMVAFGLWWFADWRSPQREPAWLLVASLDNRTGEPLMDESVPFLLEREIGAFSNLHIVPQTRVDDALRLMKQEPKARVDETVAREVCRSDGGIHLIVGSRAERVGTALQLTAWVTDAASGRILGSHSEQVEALEKIGQAVRRLVAGLPRAAGQQKMSSPGDGERLEKVMTPSLRASQPYSQAYREGYRLRWAAAEKCARDALAEDPQFASAHIWLYWAMRNTGALRDTTGKRGQEMQLHLDRAVAFSGFATDREREFILCTQTEVRDSSTDEDRVAAWRQMVVRYPDDFWARNNLAAVSAGKVSRNSGPEVFPGGYAASLRLCSPGRFAHGTRDCRSGERTEIPG